MFDDVSAHDEDQNGNDIVIILSFFNEIFKHHLPTWGGSHWGEVQWVG